MHMLLFFRGSSHVYRLTHLYAQTCTSLHHQGSFSSFQYLGVNSDAFVTKTVQVVKETVSGSGFWWKALAATAVVIGLAAVAAACDEVDKVITEGASFLDKQVEGHLEFIESLLREEELKKRLATMIGYDQNTEVLFRT